MHSTDVRGKSRLRVRPFIRRIAIVACVVLVPMAVHRLWDYIEVQRLVREIEAIQSKGEPVTEQRHVEAAQASGATERTAGAYYLAASMLALQPSAFRVLQPLEEWFAESRPGHQALAPLLVPAQRLVDGSHDGLALADTAATLRFAGFAAGTDYTYREAGLAAISNALTARTLTLAAAGHADEAAAAAVSGLQLRRVLRQGPPRASDVAVARLLSLSRPSPAALERLQSVLTAEDRTARQIAGLLDERGRFVQAIWRQYFGAHQESPRQYDASARNLPLTLLRPLIARRTVRVLRLWADLVAAARTPWPRLAATRGEMTARRDAEKHASDAGFFGFIVPSRWAWGAFDVATDPDPLILDRACLLAVSIERFRRDHSGNLPETLAVLVPRYLDAIPLDPFTGNPLLYSRGEDGYTLYSVGADQKDDGGDLTSHFERVKARGWGERNISGTDVGVRVLRQ